MSFLCSICPRKCGAIRNESSGKGYCRMPEAIYAARAGLHMWEEPCISGANGSGTVFFTGCNLRCVFCQNSKISIDNFGKPMTEEEIYDTFLRLIDQGAHNINLVTPSHYAHILIRVLDRPLPVPVVWNSSGYESVETLRALEGKVQIYLPDMKYALSDVAKRYSNAPDYPEVAKAAIMEMFRQRGKNVIGEDGLMKSGVIIRHLVLPENTENSLRVLDWVDESFSEGDVLFSLMSQYTPVGEHEAYPELNRKLLRREYKVVTHYMERTGIADGFMQGLASAEGTYIPHFDLSGLQ